MGHYRIIPGRAPRKRVGRVLPKKLSVEALEYRRLLTGAPYLATPLIDQILPTDGAGLTVGIDGADPDGDALLITATSDDPNVSVSIPPGNRFARLHFTEADGTPIGFLEVELFETRGGDAAQRFITLATNGFDASNQLDPTAEPFYTDVNVHRLIPGFIMQSGDKQNGNGTGGSPLGAFADQFQLQQTLRFSGPGVLAMANSGPNTNDSQWFITDRPTPFLNFDSGNTSAHMVFGQVISGMEDVYGRVIAHETVPDSNGTAVDPPLLASVDIYHSDQDATMTLTATPGWDGVASVTLTLDDATGNRTEQVIQLRTQAFLGDRPTINAVDLLFARGETAPLPAATDDLGMDVLISLLAEGPDNSRSGSVTIDSESGEMTVDAGDFTGIFPIVLEAREAGFDGFLPDRTRQPFDMITYGPGEPVPVGRARGSSSVVTFATFVSDNRLYLANGDDGIEVFDIVDPAAPVRLGGFAVPGQTRDIAVVGTTAIVAATQGGLVALNVADPANISVLDSLTPTELGGTASGFAVALSMVGQTALVADFAGGLVSVDVGDPATLTVRDSIQQLTVDLVLAEAVGVAVAGTRAYVADRTGQMVTIDISDLDDLTFRAALSTGAAGTTSPFGIDATSDRVYLADSLTGLIAYESTGGSDPVEKGRLAVTGGLFQVAAEGPWVIAGTNTEGFLYVSASDPAQMSVDSSFVASTGSARPTINGSEIVLAIGQGGAVLVDGSPAAVHSAVDAGVLRVIIDADLDATIGQTNGQVKINGADPDTGPVAADSLTAIEVQGGTGPNTIDLSGVRAAEFSDVDSVAIDGRSGDDVIMASELVNQVNAGPGADVVTAGQGDDAVHGGSGDDSITWTLVSGDGMVDGGTGHNQIQVIATDAADSVVVQRSGERLRIRNDSLAAQVDVQFATADSLSLDLAGDDDSLTLEDLSGFSTLTALVIDAGDGNDHIDSAAFDGPFDFVLRAGSGDDQLSGRLIPLDAGTGSDLLIIPDPAGFDLGVAAGLPVTMVDTLEVRDGIDQTIQFSSDDVKDIAENGRLVIRTDSTDTLAGGTGWVAQGTADAGNERLMTFTRDGATVVVAQPGSGWRNPLAPLDVSGNGFVEPLDVLVVINYVNAHPGDPQLPSAPALPPHFLDTNGDGFVTPIDSLLVINFLNAGGGGERSFFELFVGWSDVAERRQGWEFFV